jgi:hypothetical protein
MSSCPLPSPVAAGRAIAVLVATGEGEILPTRQGVTNMTITDALTLFLEAVAAEGLAPKTLRSYRDFIHNFINSLPPERQMVATYTASDVNRFLVSIAG